MSSAETPPRVVVLSCAGAPFSAETLSWLYQRRPTLIESITGVMLSRKRPSPPPAASATAPRTIDDIALALRYRLNRGREAVRRTTRRMTRAIGALPDGQWRRIEDFCGDRGLVPHYTRQPEGPDTVAWLRSQAPDLLLMITFHHILRPAVLGIPRLGTFNVHCSLLPALRGPDPIGMALSGRFTETGVTVHWVDAGIDTGDIVARQAVAIPPGADAISLRRELARPAAELVETLLAAAARNRIPRHAQPRADKVES